MTSANQGWPRTGVQPRQPSHGAGGVRLQFPPAFEWGVGASGFQTEGALRADGRGTSVWDDFTDGPGDACDFYHRFPEDVALVRDLGADVYRFSVTWPRVVPDGTGSVNARGLDFYDRVVDSMCEAGLKPAPTLYHWDTPVPIEQAGGWMARDTAFRFADYAAAVAERLADRAAYWIPLNEPAMLTLLGYAVGTFAPGKRLMFDALPTVHHQLLAHGLATQAIRAAGGTGVGTANPHSPVRAASRDREDVTAATLYDELCHRVWSDPILLGRYPEGWADTMPGTVADDLSVISTPLDFYGINYYGPSTVGAPDRGHRVIDADLPREIDAPFVFVKTRAPKTGLGDDIDPTGLHEVLIQLTARYGDRLPPLIVTENGTSQMPGTEEPGPDGAVHDEGRIAYLGAHVQAVHDAIADGADVRGYWVWSPTDNFEWTSGYHQRFGLVHVDFESQRRTPKDSYYWYRELIGCQP